MLASIYIWPRLSEYPACESRDPRHAGLTGNCLPSMLPPNVGASKEGPQQDMTGRAGMALSKVFISYGREDEASARQLYTQLSHRSRTIFFDRESLIPGQLWKSAIIRAIKEADIFIVLLSKSSNRRGFLNREIKEAVEIVYEQPEAKPFLIPTRLEPCEVPHSQLHTLQWVDMFPVWDEGIARLNKAINIITPKANKPRSYVLIKIGQHSPPNQPPIAASPQKAIEDLMGIKDLVSVEAILGEFDLIAMLEGDTPEELSNSINFPGKSQYIVETHSMLAVEGTGHPMGKTLDAK
jgi:hypothetical protein